jgi:hypothetical protein
MKMLIGCPAVILAIILAIVLTTDLSWAKLIITVLLLWSLTSVNIVLWMLVQKRDLAI